MARERRRLLIPEHRLGPEVTLTPAEAHYLGRVLRLTAMQGCDVVDGAGRRWSARLVAGDRLRLEQPQAEPLEQEPPSQPSLHLAVALPRQEVELIWRMATELGIDRLQPLLGDRSRSRDHWPLDRWQTILREATEQCERLWLPQMGEPQPARKWFASASGGQALRLLASSRGRDLPHWQEVLRRGEAQAGVQPSWREVWMAIGPEGGWSPDEEAIALARGWIPVQGGATILRTATAAVAAAAAMAGWRAGLSSSEGPGQSP